MLPVRRSNASQFPASSSWPVNRLDSLFEQFFGNEAGALHQNWDGVPISMWQDEEHVYIEADVPGMAEKDVEITIHNGMLFIRGERKPEEGRHFVYDGRAYGRFERVLTLPDGVSTEEVQANLSNGVLHLSLSKKPDAKPRKIEIKSN